jgi:HEAT repeat protein
MTTEEKISLLNSYDDIAVLSNKHFLILQEFSSDSDSAVRSLVAPLLVDFINETSKNILLRLAQDDDLLVRTEAYDSLAVFSFNDVEDFLKNAIQKEGDSLARSYAILSWADVVLLLQHDLSKNISFLQEQNDKEKSSDCQLSWCYAQYVFGDKSVLDELLSFLKNENYQIRCAAISLLNEIADENNNKLIRNALTKLLIVEDTIAVQERAKRFLSKL